MAEDLTGKKFGRWTVVSFSHKKEYENHETKMLWNCICECGNKGIIAGGALKSGTSKSCGCYKREKIKETHTKHNCCYTRLYRIWGNMKKRCLNPKCERFPNYGGRGIKVCNEWLDFTNFLDWAMENGYKEDLSIERIDVNGNYEPSNCKWITLEEQRYNKTTSQIYEYKGKKQPLALWCRELGLSNETVRDRLLSGMSFEEAITKPILKNSKYHLLWKENTYTAKEFAELIGYSPSYVTKQIKKGVSLDELFSRKGKKWQKNR